MSKNVRNESLTIILLHPERNSHQNLNLKFYFFRKIAMTLYSTQILPSKGWTTTNCMSTQENGTCQGMKLIFLNKRTKI